MTRRFGEPEPVRRFLAPAAAAPTDDEVRAALAKDVCPKCGRPWRKLLENGRIGIAHDPDTCGDTIQVEAPLRPRPRVMGPDE